MVKTSNLFNSQFKKLIKYIFLLVTTALLVIGVSLNWVTLATYPSDESNQSFTQTSSWQTSCSVDYLQSYAQCLTQQGHEELNQGQAEQALLTWEKALEVYTQLNDHEGIVGTEINRSLALQGLRLYPLACEKLVKALEIDEAHQICESSSEQLTKDQLKEIFSKKYPSKINAIGLLNLGNILRFMGQLDPSNQALEQSLAISKLLQYSQNISPVLLSLGNTQRAFYYREQDLYLRNQDTSRHRDQAIKKAEEALVYYNKAGEYSLDLNSPIFTDYLLSQLNSLSLLIDFVPWLGQESHRRDELKDKYRDFGSRMLSLVEELLQSSSRFQTLPTLQGIEAKINLVESLIKLQNLDNFPGAFQYAIEALEAAQEQRNKRLESQALGILAKLYKQNNDPLAAQELTIKAIQVAEEVEAWDIAYQWEHLLGQIHQEAGDDQSAIAAYDAAVQSLTRVQQDLIFIHRDQKFSFQKNIKPIYQEFIALLLKESNEEKPNQESLKKVTQITGQLQKAELENYLQCSQLELKSIEQVETQPDAAIYINVLEKENYVSVILRVFQDSQPDIFYYERSPWNEVKEKLNLLRVLIQNGKTDLTDILPHSQGLYELLFKSVLSYLPKEKALLFVLDPYLQNVPMAILQDENQQYLIENYSIAFSLGGQVYEPKPLRWRRTRALIAGLTAPNPEALSNDDNFQPLKYADDEVNAVAQNTVYEQKLTNEEFTLENFQKLITSSPFSIVHLVTHGKFSAIPKETFILAYDKEISLNELDTILRSREENSRDALELLVLSACETANGDERAALGLAGVAAQAGAQSTVASLWSVDDQSTVWLMEKFYQTLSTSRETRAEALRQAQLTFLKNPPNKRLKHPYYWGAFILVGNWL